LGSAALEHFLESSPAEKAKREVLCCFWGKCFKGVKRYEMKGMKENYTGEENKRKRGNVLL
jgi:hypothetical protein